MSTPKKYAAIAAALGWTEYEPQEDGLFLQPEEAAVIDSTLATAATTATQLEEQTLAAQQAMAAQETAEAALVTANETIEANTGRIAELEARVAELGGESSGTGTVIEVKEDPNAITNQSKTTLNSEGHDLNVEIRKRIAATKKSK
jgi:hypothetical protein